MPCITELPFLITENILKYAVNRHNHNYIKYWTRGLPLLAVCSTWRTLSLPAVYRFAFLKVNDTRDVSNIATIKANRYSQLVHYLYIEVVSSRILPIFLENYSTIFQFGQCSWINVSSLSFHITSYSTLTRRLFLECYYGKPKVTYDHFVESVIKHMPNISDLILNCKTKTDDLFFDNIVLIDAFQSQLKSLLFFTPVIFDTGLYLSNVTSLSVRLNKETGDLLPTINPLTLQYMRLSNVPSEFTWEYFHNGPDNTRKIDFISLKSLTIEYSPSEEENNDDIPDEDREIIHFSVHFPVLKDICIENGAGLPVINTTYVFNGNIRNVTIVNTIDGLQTIRNSSIKSIKYVDLRLPSTVLNNEVNTNLIDPMCNSLDVSRKMNLSLHSCQTSLEWNATGWKQLFKLKLVECTSNLFWNVCVCCPNLQKFIAERMIRLDDEHSPTNLCGNTKSSINYLRIYSIAEDEPLHKKQRFVEMAILRFGHLSIIKLQDCRWVPLEKLASDYSHQYPHLNTMDVKHNGICKQDCSSHIAIEANICF